MNYQKLVKLYEEYITLLVKEINELCVWGMTHGWKSSRVEEGRRLREEIETAKKD